MYVLTVGLRLILGGFPRTAGGSDGVPPSIWLDWSQLSAYLPPFLIFCLWEWWSLITLNVSLRVGNIDPAAGKTRRSASLQSRRRFNPITIWHWIPAWIIWLAALAVIIVKICVVEQGDVKMMLVSAVFGIMMLVCTLIVIIAAPFMVRQVVENVPEPLTETSSPELSAAYEESRIANARAAYRIFLAIIFAICAGAAAHSLDHNPMTRIWLLCLGGSVLVFAFFQLRALVKRRLRLKELLGD
jgi:hypothetical protein